MGVAGDEPRISSGRRRYGARAWMAASVLVPFLLLAGASYWDREAIMGGARDRLRSTTEALAEHAQTVMETAALALDLQLGAVRQMDWAQIGASKAVHDFLADLVHQLPQLESAFYVDPRGGNSVSSRAFPMPSYDVSERDYFRIARAGAAGLFVSPPFTGRSAGTVAFTISQARVTDGHFDGLAAVTLSPGYFRRFYEAVLDQHEAAAAALARSDGAILVRYPEAPGLPARLPADSEFLRRVKAAPSGYYEGRSIADGRTKLIAYEKVGQLPLVVSYALDRQAVLDAWYAHVIVFTVFALLASGALMLIARRVMLQSERDQTALRALLLETERRQQAEVALQQSAKMEALGRLTGGVAHDFNNLLAAILGSIDLAQRRNTDPRLSRLLSVAHQAAQRGAKLTAQMLAFARKQRVELRAIDANEVIRGADELLRRTCGSLVEVVFELQEPLWPARADAMQLELALLNLAANARDAMPEGGRLTVRSRNAAAGTPLPAGLAPGDYVVVSVADTGPGMEATVRARAFEPFFTTKGPGNGTGLGLSMVLGFAQHAGGTATVDSALGAGATVSLWLPRAAAPAVARESGRAVPDARRLHVLLVDDDETVRMSTQAMLEALGHGVTMASDGETALAALRETQQIDVLLADYTMPGMNGGEVAEAARRIRPGLPILFITGYVADDGLRLWSARGFKTLHKPFELPDLAAALRALSGASA